jgi:hypothetical protein
MKRLYFTILSILPLFVTAQKKVDLDAFRFTVQYRSLPKIKIDSTYRTYNVTVEGTRLMQPFLKDMNPENTVTLEGWKKLAENGHITIQVKLEDLLPEAVSIKERQENVKNSLGQVTGTRTFYHEEVRYSFSATATIQDYLGAHIDDVNLTSRQNKFIYNSPEFALRPLAEGYFAINTFKITSDLYRRCVTNAMHDLSETITDNYGFREVTGTDIMWIVDSRKHPEYEAHRNAFRQLSEYLFTMNASTPIEKVKEQVKPVIDYFEKIKTAYTTTSKHDRKMRYASYFNLAVLYYYLDDASMMQKQAQGLILDDYDTRDGRAFEQTAVWLKNIFQANNIYTRHFAIDVNSFKGPLEKTAVALTKAADNK